MNRIKMPREFISFSLCGTCGLTWPSIEIFYNPRWGWQCPECWDGLISRDQIMRPIFPYEGIRKTTVPGLPAYAGLQSAVYTRFFIDRLYDRHYHTQTYRDTIADDINLSSTSQQLAVDGLT